MSHPCTFGERPAPGAQRKPWALPGAGRCLALGTKAHTWSVPWPAMGRPQPTVSGYEAEPSSTAVGTRVSRLSVTSRPFLSWGKQMLAGVGSQVLGTSSLDNRHLL